MAWRVGLASSASLVGENDFYSLWCDPALSCTVLQRERPKMLVDTKGRDVCLVSRCAAEMSGDKKLKFRTTAGPFLRVLVGL